MIRFIATRSKWNETNTDNDQIVIDFAIKAVFQEKKRKLTKKENSRTVESVIKPLCQNKIYQIKLNKDKEAKSKKTITRNKRVNNAKE